jgi:hypothetical protein
MNKSFTLKASLVVAAMLALPVAQAATMTKADYTAGKARIGSDYKAAKATCAALAGNGKDVCILEAIARQNVASAELEYGYTGKPSDQNKVLVVKAESAYAVAKEKCDDLAGNSKEVCVTEAKAVETKALANAKMGKQIGEATTDAEVTKRDADLKVATEKCDAMAGDAKANCVAVAKARFGKT